MTLIHLTLKSIFQRMRFGFTTQNLKFGWYTWFPVDLLDFQTEMLPIVSGSNKTNVALIPSQ